MNQPRKNHIDTFGATALTFQAFLLGLNQVLIKVVNAGLHPVFQAGLRSLLAFFLVLTFALFARKKLGIKDGSLWPGILAGVFFSVEFILLFQGLDYTSVSRASVIFYSMPVWVAIGAHFLIANEKLTGLRVLGLLLALVGVALALSDSTATTELSLRGDLFCLAGAILWAAIALIARTTKLSKASPEMQLLYQLAVSSVVILAVSLLFDELIRELTPTIIGAFAFQVVVVVSFAFLVWFWLLSIYPASSMASFSFLAPLFGVLLGWIILDETISVSIVMALVLVGVGIYLVNRKTA